MKRSNRIFLSIFGLNVVGFLFLLLGPEPDKQEASRPLQKPYSSHTNSTKSVPDKIEKTSEQDSDSVFLFDFDVQSLELINSDLDQNRLRNRAVQGVLQNQGNPDNLLLASAGLEEKIEIHKRLDELYEKESNGILSRQEQIELLQLSIQKKKDHLELQKKVWLLYAHQAPIGPGGDYKNALEQMQKEIDLLENKLQRVENTGHRIH
ncbi:MAG TPA: hypothetical protein DEA96_00365 [Leptospiraceae bacterium]|nr:hypothetical protein [Spirochaetaceae bacterium]HBS03385.1 hypothetical protein [Leptospiraceae bacterium]|tara:strand:+ start:355 stop:975 length:621 start_codon:yes stop_codon:yes gene_type:complete